MSAEYSFFRMVYDAYKTDNVNQLLEAARKLYQQGCLAETRPHYLTHQTKHQLETGLWIPPNNPTDIALHQAWDILSEDSYEMNQIKEQANVYDEVSRKGNFWFAYIILHKAHKLKPSDGEILQLINDIISRLYLRPVDVIQNARKMFEALGLMEWVQECNYILNEETEISNQQIEIVQIIDEGNRNYSKGEYNSAIQLYNKALDINPNNHVAWYNKGLSLYNLGKYVEALQCYLKALSINPNYIEAWNSAGITLQILGENDDAIECYNKALYINPNHIQAQHNRNLALLRSASLQRSEKQEKRIKYYTSEGKPVYE